MTVPGNVNELLLAADAAGGGGYTISRSLRFNSSDSAYLSRTPASAGNRKTWTWAGWVKRASLTASYNFLFGTFDVNGNTGMVFDWLGDTFNVKKAVAGTYTISSSTTAVFRDFSAWFHLVVAFDTTQATQANRLKVYINGAEQALTGVTWALNTDYDINSTDLHGLGRAGNYNGFYFNGYLADIHFIDGQALTPTSFGEFSATTGVWMPKAFTGSYGTNGFKLDFADNSAATAAALGKDTSGNGNNFTPTNLSVTAGAGNDSLIDVPVNGSQTDTGVGGEVRGNYCTLNPLASLGSLSDGNLQHLNSSGAWLPATSTIWMSSGKWYAEFTVTSAGSAIHLGISNSSWSIASGSYVGSSAGSYGYRSAGGTKYNNGAFSSYGASYTVNDIIGIALDLDAGSLVFYKNGVSQGTAFTGLTGSFSFAVSCIEGSSAVANFGQRPFAYTAPSGFKALCTANLPAPTIVKPSTVMDVVLYTGTGSTLTPTSSLGFSPDLIWIKSRSAATDNTLYDVVRGAQARIESNNTDAEVTSDNGLTAFNSAGFTLGTLAQVNTSSATYAAWTWDAGSSTVSNTAGTITSSVRANASAGFSVVTYTGNGTSGATVGHGLGVAPSWIIVKNRASDFWVHYHVSLGKDAFLLFDTGASTTDASYWGSAAPSSSVFGTKGDRSNNRTGANFVAYCFAPVAGYSAFGSYTGNSSATDGPFVFCNFRPRWLLVKNASTAATNWILHDTARSSANVSNAELYPHLSNAEQTYGTFDILSNGFKVRGNSFSNANANGSTFIWVAFAESPFQYSRAR